MLARAIGESDPARLPRARDLATQALEGIPKTEDSATSIEQISQWLAAHSEPGQR